MSLSLPDPPYNASDPYATFLSSSCFDFLLIEVVPLAYRTAASIARPNVKTRSTVGSGVKAKGDHQVQGQQGQQQGQREGQRDGEREGERDGAGREGKTGVTGAPSRAGTEDDVQREIVSKRLEALGYRVGQGIVERFSRDRPRFTDALDVIKFLCKDLWTLLFRKQIDNLKTNHRGVYVLTDNAFKPFSRMSMRTSAEALEKAQPFLWFPCGIIRGALASLGIQAVVQAESMELPGAVFQIKTVNAKT